jgi:hypothetical protein
MDQGPEGADFLIGLLDSFQGGFNGPAHPHTKPGFLGKNNFHIIYME